MEHIFEYPLEFWISTSLLIVGAWWGWIHRRNGWGIPAIGVNLTVIAWYQWGAIYNDYLETYANEFPPPVLNEAWLQVALFALAFGIFVTFVPDAINAKYRGGSSYVAALLSRRCSLRPQQTSIETLAKAVAYTWLILFCYALWRTNWNFVGLAAPYLGEMAYPWTRGQVAESWLDSLAIVFGTTYQLCAALYGALAAILKRGKLRRLMLFLMLVSWPSFFLDRTRNVMLVVLLPGVLMFTFLRLRGHWLLQAALLVSVFLGLNFWFKFVIANRSQVAIVFAAVNKSERADGDVANVKHAGLNMYEELCWVNELMDTGIYTPNWGSLYFANLVNPIPRALWPGKPTIGLDYAIARGQGGDTATGVTATISTGMIGSGLANFGKEAGPIAAAFLMSLWCAFLARLDLSGRDFGCLLVYMIGLVVIFNFGRDITFLVAYPALFAFGLLFIWKKIAPYRTLWLAVKHPRPRDVLN